MKTETVLTIDNRGHGQDNAVAVIDDRVHRLVFNNVKVMPQVAVCLYAQRKQYWICTKQKKDAQLTNVQLNSCVPYRGSWVGWQCILWSGWGVWSRCPLEVWLCMWKDQIWCPGHGSRSPPGSSSFTKHSYWLNTVNFLGQNYFKKDNRTVFLIPVWTQTDNVAWH